MDADAFFVSRMSEVSEKLVISSLTSFIEAEMTLDRLKARLDFLEEAAIEFFKPEGVDAGLAKDLLYAFALEETPGEGTIDAGMLLYLVSNPGAIASYLVKVLGQSRECHGTERNNLCVVHSVDKLMQRVRASDPLIMCQSEAQLNASINSWWKR